MSSNKDISTAQKNNPMFDFESKLPRNTIVRNKNNYVSNVNVKKMNGRNTNTSEVDIKQVCHVCFCYSNDPIPLDKHEDQMLDHKYSYLTSLEILPKDNITLQVCEACQNDILYCYQFKIKCEKSFHNLQEFFEFKTLKVNEHTNTSFIAKFDKECQTENIKLEIPEILENGNVDAELITAVKDEDNNINEENIEYLDSEFFEEEKIEKLSEIVFEEKADNELLEEDLKKNNKKYYQCDLCPKRFHKESSLRNHLKSHENLNENIFNCEKCKESFGSEHDLRVHSALHAKGNKWICNECNKEFNDRTRLRRHIRRHFERKRYVCDCGKQFAEMCALRRHTRVHTGERVDKAHQCSLCDKRYAHKSQLVAHMAAHSGARPCACDECGKRFPSRRLLASHRRVHSDYKHYACDYCGKRFRHESTRNTHHRTHTGEKPYVCSICGKTFIQNSNLTLHMRTHSGEKPYSCETCGRNFKSGSTLNYHMRTHSGEKPFECTVCGKRFARSSMRGHMRRHTGELPHACCVCHKTFVSASRMRAHAALHTGEKPYHCKLCTAQYKKESCLTKHMKKHEMETNKKKDKDNKKKNEKDNNDSASVMFVHKVPVIVTDKFMVTKDDAKCNEDKSDMTLEVEEGPMEVSGELILEDDSNVKTELVVIDDGENNITYQNNEVLVDNYTDSSAINNINIVSVNEGELAHSELLEGTTVKLYRLDPNLVQIHTSGDQITISKICSTVTTKL